MTDSCEEEESEMISTVHESEIKLTLNEFLLNEWERWVSTADDKDEYISNSEAFEKLKNCGKSLSLTKMFLTSIPNSFPYGLKVIDLAGNQLTQIPENLPETVLILKMNNNWVRTVSGKLPSNLRELIIYYNQITSISETLPDSITSLELQQNVINTLPNQLPKSLIALNVSWNYLTTLPETLPDTLCELRAQRNRLISLPERLPESLRQLHIPDNFLTKPKINCESLIELNIENNRIEKIRDEHFNLPNLQKLVISRNKLWFLPDNLPKSIRFIKADNNLLITLPETLPEMLCGLSLRNNKLISLPKRLPKSLQQLYLAKNFLTNPKLNSESLINLDLRKNGIETILEEHFHLPNLQRLDVSHNKLTSLPTNLPEKLQFLNVAHNKLSQVQDDLPKSLQYIDLTKNEICTVSKNLPPQLKEMHLTNNKLIAIPMELPQSLEKLYLTNNCISTEISSKIENYPNTQFHLFGNPFGSNSREYLQELIRKRNKVDFYFEGSVEYFYTFYTIPLVVELTYWMDTASIHPYWNTIAEIEDHATYFCQFLYRIRHSIEYATEPLFKENMAKWLVELGEENDSKLKLRGKVFALTFQANETCEHRVSWTFNEMMILTIVENVELGKYDNNIKHIIQIAHGMYRLKVLDQIARRYVLSTLDKNYDGDCEDIEISLEYQVRLRDRFNLPITILKTEENPKYVIEDEEIERATKETIDKERIEFVDYLLLEWQPWKEVLKRWNYDRFIECESHLHNEEVYNQAFDQRKQEYLLESQMSADDELPFDVQVGLGKQVQRQIEKDIWLQLTNECLQTVDLQL